MALLFYSLSFWILGAATVGVLLGGQWTWLGVFTVFVVHPLFDHLVFGKAEARLRPSPTSGTLFLVATVPAVSIFLYLSLQRAAQTEISVEFLGLVLSAGTLMGILGINVAHELIHRKEKWLRACGVYLLMLVNFAHWGIEHVHGHHKNVATPLDSASSREGEWLYSFWIRNYFGGLHSALRIESQKRPWFLNKILGYFLGHLLTAGIVLEVWGIRGLLFGLGQSIVAILLLLSVDYIEHYGLQRNLKENGTYAPVSPEHSWDSYRAFTNYALVNLGYHSHHHFKAVVPFYELQKQESSSKLPLGYSGMILLSLIPPAFFRVMKKHVDQTRNVPN